MKKVRIQYMLRFESDRSLGLLGIIMRLFFGLKSRKKVRFKGCRAQYMLGLESAAWELL